MSQIEPNTRLLRFRVVYARREALRYISHLDMQLVWERTLRRAAVPLAYSKGFNPNPRLHMAAALPLGFLSRCEILDFWLELEAGTPDPEAARLADVIQSAAPPGVSILGAESVPLQAPALQTQVESAEYAACPLNPLDRDQLMKEITKLLDAENLPRERRGKPYNLRPLVEQLNLLQEEGEQPMISMRLSAREGATGRPEEVLAAMGLDPAEFRIERTRLNLKG